MSDPELPGDPSLADKLQMDSIIQDVMDKVKVKTTVPEEIDPKTICGKGSHHIDVRAKSFQGSDGKWYCEEHFSLDLITPACIECKQAIYGDFVEVDGHHYHSTCWKCPHDGCGVQMSQDSASCFSDGKWYCGTHIASLKKAEHDRALSNAKVDEKTSLEESHKAMDALEAVNRKLAEKKAKEKAKKAPLVKKDKYTYDELKGSQAPPGVDIKLKENWLTDEDFQKFFNTTRADFNKLPQWKRADAKKKLDLH